jgi:hypothetical protein
MLENTTLEHYSVLEEMSSVTPVWRPFVHHVDTSNADNEYEQTLEENA